MALVPVSVRSEVSVRAVTVAGCGMKFPIATSCSFVAIIVGSAASKGIRTSIMCYQM